MKLPDGYSIERNYRREDAGYLIDYVVRYGETEYFVGFVRYFYNNDECGLEGFLAYNGYTARFDSFCDAIMWIVTIYKLEA